MRDALVAVASTITGSTKADIAAIERGAMDAAYSYEGKGKRLLRADIRRARLGDKVEKSWRSNVFPNRALSMEPTVYFKNKAPKIVRAFDQGLTITARKKRYLAIPTKDLRDSLPARTKRRDMLNRAESRFGKLHFIPSKSGPGGVLVARKAQISRGKRGGFRAASASTLRKGRAEQVVLFVLVPQVRLPRRLNLAALEARMAREWPAEMASGIAAALRQGGR